MTAIFSFFYMVNKEPKNENRFASVPLSSGKLLYKRDVRDDRIFRMNVIQGVPKNVGNISRLGSICSRTDGLMR